MIGYFKKVVILLFSLFLLRKIRILIVIAVILFFIYYFPFQCYIAQRNFEQYIKLQGIQEIDIMEKRIYKDYKQNGYCIRVIYRSDPNFYYHYRFSMDDISKMFSYKSIYCTIYNHQNVEVDVIDRNIVVKYPPLD